MSELINFVKSGRNESLYITWKESGLTLSAFVTRNLGLVKQAFMRRVPYCDCGDYCEYCQPEMFCDSLRRLEREFKQLEKAIRR